MPKDFPRARRIADLMQQEIADLIRKEIKDPRIDSMLTIMAVRVSDDLGQAKIFITVLNRDGQEAVDALNHAAGFLQRALGKRMKLRSIPKLNFLLDTVTEDGMRLSSLIDQAIASDQNKN